MGIVGTASGVVARFHGCGNKPGQGTPEEEQGRGNNHGYQGKPVHHSQHVSTGEKIEKESESETGMERSCNKSYLYNKIRACFHLT